MRSVELPAAGANVVISRMKAARILMFSFQSEKQPIMRFLGAWRRFRHRRSGSSCGEPTASFANLHLLKSWLPAHRQVLVIVNSAILRDPDDPAGTLGS